MRSSISGVPNTGATDQKWPAEGLKVAHRKEKKKEKSVFKRSNYLMTSNIIRERDSTQRYVGAIFDMSYISPPGDIIHRNMWGRYSIRPTSRPRAISYTGKRWGRHSIRPTSRPPATSRTSQTSPPGDIYWGRLHFRTPDALPVINLDDISWYLRLGAIIAFALTARPKACEAIVFS